jgi:hypothetical protein
MKKLLVLAMVLSMASMASATMTLVSADSEVLIGGTTTIAITGQDEAQGGYYMGIDLGSAGNATLNIDNAVVDWVGSAGNLAWEDDPDISGILNTQNPHIAISLVDLVDPQDPLTGTIIHGIVFTGVAEGIVTVNILDGVGGLIGGVDINVTPEPITIGLLGLGAMFLRRRK